jgi:hypothetical protein
MNGIRRETSRHFRNKRREYLKDKINELPSHSKNKNIRNFFRGISNVKKGYQSINNLVIDENDDLLADSHNILNSCKNYFYHQSNVQVHGVSDVRQIEVHTAEPSAPKHSPLRLKLRLHS